METTKIGGGFAGLSAAMHLDKTLVARGHRGDADQPRNFILFTPMVHEAGEALWRWPSRGENRSYEGINMSRANALVFLSATGAQGSGK
jgi:glycine/D-amino acid oxidase-like deaminating enzyme